MHQRVRSESIIYQGKNYFNIIIRAPQWLDSNPPPFFFTFLGLLLKRGNSENSANVTRQKRASLNFVKTTGFVEQKSAFDRSTEKSFGTIGKM